jgi:hypothetical protein
MNTADFMLGSLSLSIYEVFGQFSAWDGLVLRLTCHIQVNAVMR